MGTIEMIDVQNERLGDEIARVAAELGDDVTMALLIHYLHVLSSRRQESSRAAG